MLTFGSLFAGIGGADLGFERVGMKCKWQVEIDEYATKILEKHWPKVRRYRDIREVKELEYVDVICGDSHARTSATQEEEQASPASEAGYGKNTSESFAWLDLNTLSWRTWQRSLTGDLTQYSQTWCRAGTIRNGIASPRKPLAPLTDVTGCSSSHTLWRTPSATECMRGIGKMSIAEKRAKNIQISLSAQVRENIMFPTVSARDHKGTTKKNLLNGNKRRNLDAEVILFPTPTTTTTGSNARKAYKKRTGKNIGQLTPEFCEWLMGFPIGFSELNV